MDTHSRFRTEAYKNVVPRFNERFILSLSKCEDLIILDDKFEILPINASLKNIKISKKEKAEEKKTQ